MDETAADKPLRSDARFLLSAAVLYTCLTVLLAAPFSLHPGSRVLSLGTDTDLFIWTLAWDTHALTHHPWSIFDANIFYPHRLTLAYSENLIGSALLAAPILWVTGNGVLAMNLVALLSCILSGVGACLLARRCGVGLAGSTLSGLIFAFSPPRFFRLEQLHLTTIQWVPFGLAFFHTYLDTGRKRDLRLAAMFVMLQAITSGHGAVFLILAMAALFAYRVALGEPLALIQRLRAFGFRGAAILAPMALIFIPYYQVQIENASMKRTLTGWGVSLSSFFASPSHLQTWVLSFAPPWLTEHPDAYLFPGYLPILLALGAFAWTGRRLPSVRRSVIVFYGLLLLLCLWLMLGPPLGLWQFVYWLPGLNFIRVPSRFSLLGLLALAALAGIGFDTISRHLSPTRQRAAAVGIGVLLIAEFAAVPLHSEPYAVEHPAIDRWLAGRPKPFSIAEVPLPDSLNIVVEDQRLTRYMLHTLTHWQPTVHGYSGIEPPEYRQLYWELVRFPDEASLEKLRSLGITYVVVHADLVPPSERDEFESRFVRWRDSLVLEHAEGGDRVYSVKKQKQPSP